MKNLSIRDRARTHAHIHTVLLLEELTRDSPCRSYIFPSAM